MWFQTTLRLTGLQQCHSIPLSSTTVTGKCLEEMPEQHKLCMAKTKLLTFLQESLSPPVPLCHSFLYRKIIFDTVLSLDHLPRTLFQNLAASVVFLPSQFCSGFFLFFCIFHSTHRLSNQHADAELIVFPIILITSPCLNFTGSPPAFIYQIQILALACKAPW